MRCPVLRRLVAGAAAVGVVLVGSVAAPAAGDTQPVPPLPETVAADALPTVQVDGVVWDQEIVGNRVYAVGKFTTARPAGAAPGTSTVSRPNMLAYDLTTGALVSSFAPRFNAQVLTVSASPDGRRVFVGGDFTSVNGATRNRVAAFDAATGALQSFAPSVSGTVLALDATNTTLYLGGSFTAIGGTARTRVAALNSSTGAVLPFRATVPDRQVRGLALSPDGSSVVIGGNFTSVNGSSSPGFGLARLNATSGASLSFPVNSVIRNAGQDEAIYDVYGDASGVYGVGYGFNVPDKFEGTFAADWNGNLRWMEDCHGDSYDVYANGRVTYTAGHPYKCDTIGGYPETSPRQSYYATAFTNYATGTVRRNTVAGYASFEGRPAASLLTFFPAFTIANFTGQNQATWTVTGNASYVVYGGEFTRVNGVGQQGLVRMAIKTIAPNDQGPRLSGAAARPTAVSPSAGTVQVTWPPNHDRDNATLTYRLYRRNTTAPIATRTVTATFWSRPVLSFTDTGQTPGQTRQYRVTATDPFGNTTTSDWSTAVTVASASGARVATPTPQAQAQPEADAAPDEAPTAAFAPSTSGLTVVVDGSASADPDGDVTGWAWTFGDGATGSGSRAAHTYLAAGTYTVTLTVTDDDGATATASRTVTVAGDAGPAAGADLAADTFDRSVASGWGAAPTGGAWRTSGTGGSVSGGVGRHVVATPGVTVTSSLADVVSTATEVRVSASVDRASTGGGQYLSVVGRRVGTADYRARVRVEPSGAVVLQAARGETVLASAPVTGLSAPAGTRLRLRLEVVGTAPTTVRAKVWRDGATEPAAWQVSTTDGTAALQSAGSVGLTTYVSGAATAVPVTVSWDDLQVRPVP